MDDIKKQVQALSAAEFQAFYDWVVKIERPERAQRQVTEAAASAAVIDVLDQLGVEPPPAAKVQDPPPGDGGEDTATPSLPPLGDIPEWVNPGTAWAKMYRHGAVVRHNGRVWVNNYPEGMLNSWEPGAPGVHAHDNWEDVTWRWEQPETPEEDTGAEATEPAPPAAPEYKQPTGGHDAYKKGDQVTYKGAVYESLIDGNVWAPDAYPAGWRKL